MPERQLIKPERQLVELGVEVAGNRLGSVALFAGLGELQFESLEGVGLSLETIDQHSRLALEPQLERPHGIVLDARLRPVRHDSDDRAFV